MDDASGQPTEDAGDGPLDSQWTPAALAAYRAAADRLVETLREHVRLTVERQGRQRELHGYFASAEQLQAAVNAFAEAEFDWCGSFPVRTDLHHDDEEVDDGPVADPTLEQAPVVSVLGRWDYLVTDGAALVEHGRRAYLQAWPQDTEDDAAVRVTDVEGAVNEILHGPQLPELDDARGLQPLRSSALVVRHAGTSEDEFFHAPFALLHD